MAMAMSATDTTDTTEQDEDAPLKPYLLRVIHQWAVERDLTPQVLVDAGFDEVVVPVKHVRDGRISLNLHPRSAMGLEMGNRYLLFSTRFAGQAFEVCIPVAAIMAIYCRENGQGVGFQPGDGGSGKDTKKRKDSALAPAPAHLKLVK